jgi:hypothetical protein
MTTHNSQTALDSSGAVGVHHGSGSLIARPWIRLVDSETELGFEPGRTGAALEADRDRAA